MPGRFVSSGNNQRAQTLRCRIHGGCQSGRTGAHDGQVVLRQKRGRHHSKTRRHILHRGWSKPDPVRENAYGQQVGIHLAGRDHHWEPFDIFEIHPVIRDAIAAQEVTNGKSRQKMRGCLPGRPGE
jgi:hypothetical protein